MQLSAKSASRKASRFGVDGAALAVTVAIFVGYRKLPDNTSASFLPHLYCYLGNTRLIWLHVTSDLLIGLSYVAISSTLAYLVWRERQSIPFSWMFIAFGAFIIACGFTHFMEVLVICKPVYWLSGAVKVVTALASLTTAMVLPTLVPKIHKLATSTQSSEQGFKALLQSAPDAMVVVDRSGTIVLVNSQTEQIFGYQEQELLGQPVEILIPKRFTEGHPGQRTSFLPTRGFDPWARDWNSLRSGKTALSSRLRSASARSAEKGSCLSLARYGTSASAATRKRNSAD